MEQWKESDRLLRGQGRGGKERGRKGEDESACPEIFPDTDLLTHITLSS
jgi:hypothetical protein